MREINNMEELKMAQMELHHRIDLKEMELQAHANSLKELVNPMTYINLALSKVAVLEQFAASFYKGYTTVKDMIAKYRSRNSNIVQEAENDQQ